MKCLIVLGRTPYARSIIDLPDDANGDETHQPALQNVERWGDQGKPRIDFHEALKDPS
jgi:hypothetical protein